MTIRTCLLSAALITAMSTTVSADIQRGQKAYSLACKSCHGNGSKGAAMATQDEWDELFESNAAKIIKKHSKTKANMFFNGPVFKSRAKDLHDFLFNYASDSGNVPSC